MTTQSFLYTQDDVLKTAPTADSHAHAVQGHPDIALQTMAASAAGLVVRAWWEKYPGEWWAELEVTRQRNDPPTVWSSLHDDGDALRLAAALKIDIEWQSTNQFPEPHVEAYQRNPEGPCFCASEHENDYRRAITRAAADQACRPTANLQEQPKTAGGSDNVPEA